MDELKFEISVIFVKFGLDVYTPNELIKKEYESYFRKEVSDEEVNRIVGNFIDDSIKSLNGFIVEIPEDFEMNKIR